VTSADALPAIGGGMRIAERLLIPVLSVLVATLFVAALLIGRVPVEILDFIAGENSVDTETAALILGEIRLPRALLAAFVGASLGLAGAAMQALLRNPLAEPGVLGVSATAALGAVIVFYSGLAAFHPLLLPLGGMAGALVAVAAVHALAGREVSVLTLILAGAAVNAFAGALTALALSLAPNPYAAVEIVFWMLGSFADRSFDHVLVALPLMISGWILLMLTGRAGDALGLGEDVASSLGISLGRARLFTTLGTALAVGASVAVAGVIGFVGLVVPHLLRPFAGYQPSRLLLPSALGGAALTLAADIVVRLNVLSDRLATGTELKVGVVTALIGAPFFLWLILATRRAMR